MFSILIVDSRASRQTLIRLLLEKGGIRTYGAQTPYAATRMIELYAPDLVLLVGDGPEADSRLYPGQRVEALQPPILWNHLILIVKGALPTLP